MKKYAFDRTNLSGWQMGRIGRMALTWLCLASLLPASASLGRSNDDEPPRAKRPEQFQRPGLIEFKGEIDRSLTRYFNSRFEQARRDGVDLLIIEIESPGGLKFESLEMAGKLSKCDWAYTVALIPKEAISGGALLALGCDEILIAADAKLGNIGEIGFDPEAMAFRLIRPKVESSLAHDARELAKAKGRPADLVEAFVDKDITVYRQVGKNGEFEYQQVRADDPNKPAAPWELIEETKPERFLTLSGKRALELGLASQLVQDRDELAKSFGLGETYRVYRYTSNDAVVHVLNSSLVTVLIIAIGLIALYVEFSSPGLGAGGLIAGLCMLLFFWSRFLGGTAGFLEILLFAAGMVFLAMEIFVIPGFGISGLLGIGLLFTSALMASQDFTIPSTPEEWNHSLNSMLVLMGAVAIFFIAATFISRHFGSLPVFNRLVLEPPAENSLPTDADNKNKPVPLAHPLISVGDWGKAESLLRPAGRASFAGRAFDVISDGTFIEAGAQVKVIRIRGNVITVAKADA